MNDNDDLANPVLAEQLAEGAYYSINGEQIQWEYADLNIRTGFIQMGYDMIPFILPVIRAAQEQAWDDCADRIEIDGGYESAITDHLREHNPYRTP